MSFTAVEINVVYACAPLVPPPGAGVVTVTLWLPGNASEAAGKLQVIPVELTNVHGIVTPFSATAVCVLKPVPVSITALAVLMGPPLGLRLVNVGTGGLTMDTLTEFETAGLAFGVFTVTLAVPAVVKSEAGTVATSS
jgi:hypothetical protein